MYVMDELVRCVYVSVARQLDPGVSGLVDSNQDVKAVHGGCTRYNRSLNRVVLNNTSTEAIDWEHYDRACNTHTMSITH